MLHHCQTKGEAERKFRFDLDKRNKSEKREDWNERDGGRWDREKQKMSDLRKRPGGTLRSKEMHYIWARKAAEYSGWRWK